MQNNPRPGSWTPWLVGLVVLAMGTAMLVAFAHRAEPRRVILQNIWIGIEGYTKKAHRTIVDAERLAQDLYTRAKNGEDFDALMKAYSDDDPGNGIYALCNRGVTQDPGEHAREALFPAFGDVGFKLRVDQIGMAPYDPKASPYGWHIIKRLK